MQFVLARISVSLDRFGPGKNQQEMALLFEKVKREIYMTIVALFDQAHRLSIEITIGLYICPIVSRTPLRLWYQMNIV
jgi:hypothetical protein